MSAALGKINQPENLSRAELLRFHALSSGLALASLLVTTGCAWAHPHIFVDAEVAIAFDKAGNVTAIEHHWAFDRAFSAWQVQGLDADGDGAFSRDELFSLTLASMRDLAQHEFYTFAGEGAHDLSFQSGPDGQMSYAGGRVVLNFTVRPSLPYRIGRELEIAIYDPEYYVALALDDISAVTLLNAPAGCSASLRPPRELPSELIDQLNALPAQVTKLPPELAAVLRGMQGAILVRCDENAPPDTDFDRVPVDLPFGRLAH